MIYIISMRVNILPRSQWNNTNYTTLELLNKTSKLRFWDVTAAAVRFGVCLPGTVFGIWPEIFFTYIRGPDLAWLQIHLMIPFLTFLSSVKWLRFEEKFLFVLILTQSFWSRRKNCRKMSLQTCCWSCREGEHSPPPTPLPTPCTVPRTQLTIQSGAWYSQKEKH